MPLFSQGYFFFYLKIAIILLMFTGCENDIATVKLLANQKKFPVESGRNVEIIYSDSAKMKMKLISQQIDRYTGLKPYLEFPNGVKIEFYDQQMKIKSQLTAHYAIRYEGEKRMEAKRNVVVVNEKGETLNTEHLIWDEGKDMIYTEEFVKITTQEEILYGDGLESNQDFSKYKIKNIKGIINLHETK